MKKVLVTVLGLLFVGVAGVLAWKAVGPATVQTAQAVDTNLFVEPTKLLVSQGQATILREGGSPVKVTDELELKEGDTVQVETSGRASIEWSDGSVTRLSGGTEVKITKHKVDQDTGKQETTLDLRTGEAWTKVLNVVQDDSSMQVRAQSTVAGIRGTSLYAAASATGVVMMPMEHGVEAWIEGTETREMLLEGEGMQVQGTAMTKVGSGKVLNAFIKANQEEDKKYLGALAEDRRAAFEAKMEASKGQLPEREAFEKEFTSQQGTDEERAKKLGVVLDRLAYEMLMAQEKKDTVRLAELTEYYEGLVPMLKEATSKDFPLRSKMRLRVQLHMAILFSAGVTDDTFLTRQAIVKARLALMDENDEAAMRRLLRREMFFASDLALSGKDRQVEEVLATMQEAFKKPLMENATKVEEDMFVRLGARMEASVPSSTSAMEALRRQLYLEKQETNSNEQTNINENQNTEVENVNENTNTRRTNTNTNTRTNTNTNAVRKTNTNTNTAAKPANTNVNKTTTTTTTTTTVKTNTNTSTTLVPAPVRTSTTTTTRPVLTTTP